MACCLVAKIYRATSADFHVQLHGSPDYRLALEPPLAEIKISSSSTTHNSATSMNKVDCHDMDRDAQKPGGFHITATSPFTPAEAL